MTTVARAMRTAVNTRAAQGTKNTAHGARTLRQLRTQASRQATVTHARTGGQFYKHAPKWAFLGGLGAYFGFGEDGEVLSTDDNHNMKIIVSGDKHVNGEMAAHHGAQLIAAAIKKNGKANVILATGASQFEMIENLIHVEGVDWSKVTCFHLDEYVGITDQHPASFKKYLKERFQDQVEGLGAFHYVDGSGDSEAECARLNALITQYPIDVAFIGVGENGHLAFNDPPCDVATKDPYIVVTLDEACRQQQMGEGWFATMDDVPKQAISMSMAHILKSDALVCTIPDERKAAAVKGTVTAEITPEVPGSYLRTHPHCLLFLDTASAGLL